jgi:hypothetical protein
MLYKKIKKKQSSLEEVRGSNIGETTGYPEICHDLPQYLQANSETALSNRPHPHHLNPYLLTIHGPHHVTLCNFVVDTPSLTNN